MQKKEHLQHIAEEDVLPSEQQIYFNLSRQELIEHALQYMIPLLDPDGNRVVDASGETVMTPQAERVMIPNPDGSLTEGPINFIPRINSRTPKAKHYVKTPNTEGRIWEKINTPQTPEQYTSLKSEITEHLSQQPLYIVDVALGAQPTDEEKQSGFVTRQTVRFKTNSPVHALFAATLYKDLTPEELLETQKEDYTPDVTIIHSPDFTATPERHGTVGKEVVTFHFDEHEIIIAGTDYLGEIKKAGFTWMHEVVRRLNSESSEDADRISFAAILHAALVQKADGSTAAFFGGSGAGKSSAPPRPTLEDIFRGYMNLVDDEGIVKVTIDENGEISTTTENIEGGIYVTLPNIDNEPIFKRAVEASDSLIESVFINPDTKTPDYKHTVRTTNTRGAAHITSANLPTFKESGISGPLQEIVLLDPDTRGILPPWVKFRNKYQAMAWLLVGLGAKIPGREEGVKKVEEQFNPLLDEPFLPYHPVEAIDSILPVIEVNQIQSFLVSSGWEGGPVGVGERMPLAKTQEAAADILEGQYSDDEADYDVDPIFGWLVPKKFRGANVWEDKEAYEESRKELARAVRTFAFATYSVAMHPEMENILGELPSDPDRNDVVIFPNTTIVV